MAEFIILGILQGIFEWIPISSEGVVALVSQIFEIETNPVNLALFLHLGTLLAVLIYFRKDWREVLSLKDKELFRFLIAATLISLAAGFPLYKMVKEVAIGAGLLLIMGFGLFLTAFFQRTNKRLNLSFSQLALVAGVLQGFSVIPGLSRSGSTIFGLSLGRLSPPQILKISYMMSAPVILASTVYLLGFEDPQLFVRSWPALIFSFVVGIGTLHFLIRFSQRINFFKFALIFGILCLLGAALEVII